MLYQITNYLIGFSLKNFFLNFHSPNIRFVTKFSDLMLLLSLLFFSFVSSQLCNTIFSLWSLRVPLLSVFFVFSMDLSLLVTASLYWFLSFALGYQVMNEIGKLIKERTMELKVKENEFESIDGCIKESSEKIKSKKKILDLIEKKLIDQSK